MEADHRTAEDEEKIKTVRSIVGSETPESDIRRGLSLSGDDPAAAAKFIADNPVLVTVKRTMTSTGARISAQIGGEEQPEESEKEKGEKVSVYSRMSFDEFLRVTDTKVMTTEEYLESKPSDESRCEANETIQFKEEPDVHRNEESPGVEEKSEERKAVNVASRMSFDEFLKVTNTKVMTTEEFLSSQAKEVMKIKPSEVDESRSESNAVIRVEEGPGMPRVEESLNFGEKREGEPGVGFEGNGLNERVKPRKFMGLLDIIEEFEQWCEENGKNEPVVSLGSKASCEGLNAEVKQEAPIAAVPLRWATAIIPVKDEPIEVDLISSSKPIVPVKQEPVLGVEQKVLAVKEEPVKEITRESFVKKFNRIPNKRVQSLQNSSDAKKQRTEDQKPCHVPVEDGDFPKEPNWFLVGRTMVTALSTTKGRKLADNEIVHFSLPSTDWRSNAHWIVRFSTKRFGEV